MRRISTPGANGEQNCLRSVRKGWQSSVGDGKIKRKADRGTICQQRLVAFCVAVCTGGRNVEKKGRRVVSADL